MEYQKLAFFLSLLFFKNGLFQKPLVGFLLCFVLLTCKFGVTVYCLLQEIEKPLAVSELFTTLPIVQVGVLLRSLIPIHSFKHAQLHMQFSKLHCSVPLPILLFHQYSALMWDILLLLILYFPDDLSWSPTAVKLSISLCMIWMSFFLYLYYKFLETKV